MDTSDIERAARVLELRRLVQSGEYQVNAQEVAAGIIRESEMPQHTASTPISKVANAAD